MGDKEVIKFTRDGIEKKNLATGETTRVTTSEYGKQTHYKTPSTNVYAKNHASDLNAPAGELGDIRRRPLASRKTTKAEPPAEEKEPLGGTERSPVRWSEGTTENRITGGRKKEKLALSSSTFSAVSLRTLYSRGQKIKQSGADILHDTTDGSSDGVDEGASKIVTGAARAPSTAGKHVLTKIHTKRAGDTEEVRTEGTLKRRLFQRKRLQMAAQKAAAEKAASTAASVNAGAKAVGAASSPAGLIVGGTIALVVLVSLIFLPVFALFAVNQSSDELAAYLLDLDNAFLDRANNVERGKEEKLIVEGAYLVHTNANDMTVLLNALGMEDRLSSTVKKKVEEIHRILNTYTVRKGIYETTPVPSPDVPDPGIQKWPAVFVTIQTYTAQEKLTKIGLSASQQDAYLNMLQLAQYGEIGNTFAGGMAVSEAVLQYDPLIRNYAMQYGIGDYVPVIYAVMMQESGGQGTDPMQSSECGYNTKFPRVPGAITDPEYSIDCGVHELADCLKKAGCTSPTDMARLSLALQGYNFGAGYVEWAMRLYGGWSENNAVTFSEKMKKELGVSVYGDVKYVEHVLRYLSVSGSSAASLHRFVWPMPGYTSLSSSFGGSRSHKGIDIAGANISGKPIVAAESGTVTTALHKDDGGSYGLHVDIKHTEGYITRYAHCSRVIVSAGQKVTKGQVIAYVGSTGNSTGPHLHFEIRAENVPQDPLNYFDRREVTM